MKGNLRRVYKTKDEAKLKIRYTELISRPQTPEQFAKIVEDFKKDVEIIIKQNPLYENYNSVPTV